VIEEARSLSVEEQLLREFLLDQILFLQESLELWLMPCIVEELFGHERVAAPPLDKDFPSPSAVRGQGGESVISHLPSLGGSLGGGGS
jgi:hypothetical protein